jgi:hypothetical protein
MQGLSDPGTARLRNRIPCDPIADSHDAIGCAHERARRRAQIAARRDRRGSPRLIRVDREQGKGRRSRSELEDTVKYDHRRRTRRELYRFAARPGYHNGYAERLERARRNQRLVTDRVQIVSRPDDPRPPRPRSIPMPHERHGDAHGSDLSRTRHG